MIVRYLSQLRRLKCRDGSGRVRNILNDFVREDGMDRVAL